LVQATIWALKMYLSSDHDIIAAIATPPGKGGVAIMRISGHDISAFLKELLSKNPQPRQATFTNFLDANGEAIDQGLAIFFPSPHSFTGESVLELHGHGGPAVMDALLRRSLELGARLARAGEFSERAFLNDKIDLTQAEAIADLINASSEQAARCAMRSLQGEFSKHISVLVESLTTLRIYVEAAIDFPEEEIDFLADPKISNDLNSIIADLSEIKIKAKQGALISEGMTVVIAGKPNAGKSSLLNALSGQESAIVTPIAGTTRDVLKENIHIDGMPLHIIDTAGLRETKNLVEKEGIKRAWDEIDRADRVLFIIDSSDNYSSSMQENWPDFFERYPGATNISFVLNKADVSRLTLGVSEDGYPVIALSAKYRLGIEGLTSHLTNCMGFDGTNEGSFVARRRHLEALKNAEDHLLSGRLQLLGAGAGELLAEDLRLAQKSLALITGAFTSDDLLGRIFSSFCVGK
jgi:tRNA modification GTPase